MNSCILMAEITQNPELRSTADNQMEIAEMFVQFINAKPENPPALIKVVGWNNLAREIKEKYRQGDKVVIEGRLEMNTIDKPEGYKEKRAQLIASRIHPLGATDMPADLSTPAASSNTPPAAAAKPTNDNTPPKGRSSAQAVPPVETYDNDEEIPF
jgi:single-stranded DNA-binding protein